MYVSNVPNLKIGDGFRTPGEPVPEFRKWPASAQDAHLRQRRVVDVTPDVAEEMRREYGERAEKANKARLRQQFEKKQASIRTLSRQIATSKQDTLNKAALLSEAEDMALKLAAELGLDESTVEMGVRPPPPAPKEHAPLLDTTPQALADKLADLSDIDLRTWAAEEIDLDHLDETQTREAMLKDIFGHVYGGAVVIPPPQVQKPGKGLVSAADIEDFRKRLLTELEAASTTQLRKQAKELRVGGDGPRDEVIKRLAAAFEQRELAKLGR